MPTPAHIRASTRRANRSMHQDASPTAMAPTSTARIVARSTGPAGRITLCLAAATAVAYAWKTIDAPLENLGLYRAAMTNGCFGPVSEETVGEEGTSITVTTELSDAAKTNLGRRTRLPAPRARPPGMRAESSTQPCDGDEGRHALGGRVPRCGGGQEPAQVTLDEIINLNNYLGSQQVDLHHGAGR